MMEYTNVHLATDDHLELNSLQLMTQQVNNENGQYTWNVDIITSACLTAGFVGRIAVARWNRRAPLGVVFTICSTQPEWPRTHRDHLCHHAAITTVL